MIDVKILSEIQDLIDQLKKQEGVLNMPLSIDLGSYWHLTPKTIGGVIINGEAVGRLIWAAPDFWKMEKSHV
jgi:hypothetical protein